MAKMSKEQLQEIIQPSLDKLIAGSVVVDGALVVTVDGHLLAKNIDGDSLVKRLASMGSSLMSLGNTITGELEMGLCKNVLIENEGGFVAFMHINKKLVLVSMTKSSNGLGMLLNASRACATSIAKNFQF